MSEEAAQSFFIGQRVRVAEDARGAHWPDVGHWIATVAYAPDVGQVLYGIAIAWPPVTREEIQDGFYASDLSLWAD